LLFLRLVKILSEAPGLEKQQQPIRAQLLSCLTKVQLGMYWGYTGDIEKLEIMILNLIPASNVTL
jgi:hypothetical protein